MSKIDIIKHESVTTTPCEAQVSMAQVLAALRLPPDATVTLVTANGLVGITDEDALLVSFVKRTQRKARKAAEK